MISRLRLIILAMLVLAASHVTSEPRQQLQMRKTVGFISNGKEGTKRYFGHLERMLREELGVADVVWRTKSNYSAPADAYIVDEIKRWHAVVAGVGD